jgi:CRP/FNR family transcriptional regulator, cyclic AMP receptor protein
MPTRTASALDRLSPRASALLAGVARPIEYGDGAVVLREGADTPFLGLVVEGRVALRLRVPEGGDRVTLATVEPGELVGWSAVVAPFRSAADAVATESTRVLAYDAPSLRALIAGDPDLASEVLPIVLACVASRLGASWQQLLDLFGPGAPEPW